MDRVSELWQAGSPPLEARVEMLSGVLAELSRLGPANILYSDSEFLYAFANRRTQTSGRMEPPGMYYLERHCECDSDALQDCGVQLHSMPQDIVLFASVPLSSEQWLPFGQEQLIVSREGKIVWGRQPR